MLQLTANTEKIQLNNSKKTKKKKKRSETTGSSKLIPEAAGTTDDAGKDSWCRVEGEQTQPSDPSTHVCFILSLIQTADGASGQEKASQIHLWFCFPDLSLVMVSMVAFSCVSCACFYTIKLLTPDVGTTSKHFHAMKQIVKMSLKNQTATE